MRDDTPTLDDWQPGAMLDQIDGVTTYHSVGAAPLLSWLCWVLDAHNAIEIGVGHGYTTRVLATSLMRPASLLSVEVRGAYLARLAGVMADFEGVRWYPVLGHSNVVLRKSAKALGFPPADIILIDGGHSTRVVRRDFATARELLADGGVMVFHEATGPMAKRTRPVLNEARDSGWDVWTTPTRGDDQAHAIVREPCDE